MAVAPLRRSVPPKRPGWDWGWISTARIITVGRGGRADCSRRPPTPPWVWISLVWLRNLLQPTSPSASTTPLSGLPNGGWTPSTTRGMLGRSAGLGMTTPATGRASSPFSRLGVRHIRLSSGRTNSGLACSPERLTRVARPNWLSDARPFADAGNVPSAASSLQRRPGLLSVKFLLRLSELHQDRPCEREVLRHGLPRR